MLQQVHSNGYGVGSVAIGLSLQLASTLKYGALYLGNLGVGRGVC